MTIVLCFVYAVCIPCCGDISVCLYVSGYILFLFGLYALIICISVLYLLSSSPWLAILFFEVASLAPLIESFDSPLFVVYFLSIYFFSAGSL